MSDSSGSRNERSFSNRLYPTLGEAHRNITNRGNQTSRKGNHRATEIDPDQVSPLSFEGRHQELQPPSPSSLYGDPDSHHNRSSFAPQTLRPIQRNTKSPILIPEVFYDPASSSRNRPMNLGQTSRESNYRAENEVQYEQQNPYVHYDDIVKSSPDDSRLHGQEYSNKADGSKDHACYDNSWNIDSSINTNVRCRFLQQNSERQLSQVLGEASRISNPAFKPEENQTTLGRSRSIVEYRPSFNSSGCQNDSPHANEFYNNAAIDSSMQIEDNGVRVFTSRRPGRGSPDMDEAGNGTGPSPWSQLSDEQFSHIPLENLASMQALADAHGNFHFPEDWETVTDGQGGSRNLCQHSTIGRVIHGSSIADYSDRLLPEEAHNLDGSSSDYHAGWCETPFRQPPLRGYARATDGNVSAYRQYQEPVSNYRHSGFQPTPLRGVSAQEARSALYNRQEQSTDQHGPSYELSNLRLGRETPIGRDSREYNGESSRNPFRWDRVTREVQAHQAQLEAERIAAEPPQLGRPLSGFDHVKLPCGLISLEDAYIIQRERRASGLEDQSESGNYISHHPMISPRYNDRAPVESEPRRAALNTGPDYYTPLSPSTGVMVQPELPTQGLPLFHRAGVPVIPPHSASVAAHASVSTRPFVAARPSRIVQYTSNPNDNGIRNTFMTQNSGRTRKEQEQDQRQQHEDFFTIDLGNLLPPRPAYHTYGTEGSARLGNGSRGSQGLHAGTTSDNSDAEFWRADIEPRDRNPCRRRATLTQDSRQKLEGIFWGLFVINMPLPLAAAVTYSRHFSDALSWMTRGEICHLRS